MNSTPPPTVFCSLLKNHIYEISWLFQTFGCGYPYDFFLNFVYTLWQHFWDTQYKFFLLDYRSGKSPMDERVILQTLLFFHGVHLIVNIFFCFYENIFLHFFSFPTCQLLSSFGQFVLFLVSKRFILSETEVKASFC